jgi:bacteriorhodopsin
MRTSAPCRKRNLLRTTREHHTVIGVATAHTTRDTQWVFANRCLQPIICLLSAILIAPIPSPFDHPHHRRLLPSTTNIVATIIIYYYTIVHHASKI